MRILSICRFLPHPDARDSGSLDTYHYLEALSLRHDVSVIAFARDRERRPAERLLRRFTRVVAVPYDEASLLPRLARAWWRFLLPRVYGRCISLNYYRSLKRLLAEAQFDVAIVDGMMASYGALVQRGARVLDEVDIYSTVAYHAVCNEPRSLWRLISYADWLRLQAGELAFAARYDGVMVRSHQDRVVLASYIPRSKIHVAAPWFEGLGALQSIPAARPAGNRILFVGALGHPKSVEAIHFFVHSIFPLVRAEAPDAELLLVGGNPAQSVRRLSSDPSIHLVGEVDDLVPYYAMSAVNIAPLLSGGGVIVKTLNGLAAARPTVATSEGNSGTGATPGRDLIVANGAQEYARAVVMLLRAPEQWNAFAASGRHFIRAHYDWGETCRRLEEFLADLAARRSSHSVESQRRAPRLA